MNDFLSKISTIVKEYEDVIESIWSNLELDGTNSLTDEIDFRIEVKEFNEDNKLLIEVDLFEEIAELIGNENRLSVSVINQWSESNIQKTIERLKLVYTGGREVYGGQNPV